MSAATATAIVVTYNSADQIESTLRALREAELDVVVIDNASLDATTTIVRRDFPEVALIANRTNVGFARAVNQGLQQADGCLLYTSPSPRDRTRSRMPSSA